MARYGTGFVALGVVILVVVVAIMTFWPREADYADLVPPPDSIIWEQGDETALWLSTNRHAVDLRIDSRALGIGEIVLRDPAQGAASALGEGLGCLDAVVDGLTVSNITATSADITISFDKESGSAVTVHYRQYRGSEAAGSGRFESITGDSIVRTRGGLTTGAVYRYEASTDEHFPLAITRSVTWTAGEADSGTSDHRDEELHMLEDTGVELIACREHEDVLVSLHGDGGKELNRYLVDVLPASTPTPTPPATTPAAYAAVGLDNNFTAPEFLSQHTGNSSSSLVVTVPNAGSDSHFAFAVRSDLDPDNGLTDMRETGSGFNSRASFAPASGNQGVVLEIDGQDYHVYTSVAVWYRTHLGREWTLQ